MEKSVKKHWLLGRLARMIDRETKELGLTGLMGKIVVKTGTKLRVDYGETGIKEIVRNKPVIIVANHPAESDVVALNAAISGRKKVSMVIMAEFTGISRNLDRYLLPVYIHHRTENKKDLKLGLFKHYHANEYYGYHEAHQKNIDSINEGSRRVNRGEAVVIFPGEDGMDKWLPGVGYMIKNLNREAYVVMADIKGTTKFDYIRLIPGIRRIMPAYQVNFFSSIKVNGFKEMEGKDISKMLAAEYEAKLGKLKNSQETRINHNVLIMLRSWMVWIMTRLS